MTNHDFALRLAQACFPGWKGRTISAREFCGPQRVPSYWDGGSIDKWAVLNTATGECATVPENGGFLREVDPIADLPPGCVMVERSVCRGKDLGVTLHLRADDLARWFPPEPGPPDDLTWAEIVVLVATRTLKNSYGGRKNIRFTQSNYYTKITAVEWEAAKAQCQAKGWLNHAGAITEAGSALVPFEKYGQIHSDKLKREAWSVTVAAEQRAPAPAPVPVPLAA